MTVASEIARLQGVKTNILDAIAAKGVTVPSGAMLADCPSLISSISGGGGGGFDTDSIVNIVPINKIVVVDANGYIGYDLKNYFKSRESMFYYNYAILSAGDNFANKGLGQVTLYTPDSTNIGGRIYNTAIIGGKEWMAENLDFKFSGLAVGESGTSSSEPRANYYNNDEDTYGENGNKYGLLYNWIAIKYLQDNKSQLIPGWHVPTTNEWDALATAVGGNCAKLKSTSGWSSSNGDGSTAFSAFPAGYYSGSFNAIGQYADFWTITEANSSRAYGRSFSYGTSSMDSYDNIKERQYSLRLVKDSQ